MSPGVAGLLTTPLTALQPCSSAPSGVVSRPDASSVKFVSAGGTECFVARDHGAAAIVKALDKVEAMRCILCLHETVTTGAADGYYRMAERPASTLLHLGPGLANALAGRSHSVLGSSSSRQR